MLEIEHNLFYISAYIDEGLYDEALIYINETKKIVKKLRRKRK